MEKIIETEKCQQLKGRSLSDTHAYQPTNLEVVPDKQLHQAHNKISGIIIQSSYNVFAAFIHS